MAKSKYTDELKQEVLKAAEPYLIQGWNLRTIHKQLEAEYQNEGKEMISWWSFYPLAKAMLEELKAEGKISADTDGQDGSASAEATAGQADAGIEEPSEAAEEPDEAAEEAEEDQGEEPETEDDGGEYVRTLEDMLRLYRRRTEADVDAVCDRLLPGLLAEEE